MSVPNNAWSRDRVAIGLLAPDIQKALLQGKAPADLDPDRHCHAICRSTGVSSGGFSASAQDDGWLGRSEKAAIGGHPRLAAQHSCRRM